MDGEIHHKVEWYDNFGILCSISKIEGKEAEKGGLMWIWDCLQVGNKNNMMGLDRNDEFKIKTIGNPMSGLNKFICPSVNHPREKSHGCPQAGGAGDDVARATSLLKDEICCKVMVVLP